MIYLVIFIVGSIIYYAVNSSSRNPTIDSSSLNPAIDLSYLNPAEDLANKFTNLGNMTGMHMDSISEEVGAPNSRSLINEDILLQWIVPGYHISILFDGLGYFKWITHESLNT